MQALKLKSKHKTEELKTRPQSMQKILGVKLAIWVWLLTTFFITIWVLNIQMKNVNPFSIFRLQYLLNGFKRTQFAHFLLFAFLSQKFKTLWNCRFPKVKVGRPFQVLGFTFPHLLKCVLNCITLSQPITFLCFSKVTIATCYYWINCR
jgi:hypothetical protein